MTVVIQDEFGVHLRSWVVTDAQLYVQARDEEVFRWTTERRELTVAETEAAIQAVNASDSVFSFAIVDSQSNEILGNMTLVRDKENEAAGEAMYWLSSSARGRGIATQALRLLCHWAFTELGLEQIILKTYLGNVRSQQVAARAGFRRFQPSDEQSAKSGVCWYKLTCK